MDLASLAIKIDSTEAGKAATDLDKVTAAGGRAERATAGTGREFVKASSAAGKLRMEELSAAAAADKMANSTKGAGAAASKMAADAQKAAVATKQLGQASGLAAHHTQNLLFQVQDIGVGLASGQKPLTVFLQQGAQIQGIMGQAGIGVMGLAKALGAIALKFAPAIIAIGAGAAALHTLTETVNEQKRAELDAYTKSLGLTAEQIEEAGGAAVTSSDMLLGLWDVFKEFAGVEAIFADVKGWIVSNITAAAMSAKKNLSEIYAAAAATVDGIKHVWANLGPIMGNAVVAGVNAAIGALEWLVNKAIEGVRQITLAVNPLLKAADMAGLVPGAPSVRFGRVKDVNAGAGAAAADAFASAYQKRLGESHNAFDKFMGDWADAGAARTKERLSKVAKDAGGAAGKAGGRAAGKATADEFAKGWEEAWGDAMKGVRDILKDMDKTVAEIAKAESDYLAAALKEGTDAWERAYQRREEATRRLQEQVDALLGSLGRMKGIGGLFGDIGGILTSGNPIAAMLGMGGLGTIAGSVLGGAETTKRMGTEFSNALIKTFGVKGELAEQIGGTLANVFQGAAVGGSVGGIMGGGKGGMLGATAGGALGSAFSSSLSNAIGGAMGKIAGAALPIVGSIVGNLLGSALSSTKRGGATIGAGGVAGTWGNSQQRIGAASGIGGNAVNALEQLASALGVPLGTFSSSISVREGNLRFDPSGSGISKTSKGAINFGQDEAALLKAVIADAISDGAFQGLSEGFKAYLTSGDVEKRLQDVLSLRGALDELRRIKDPTGFALEGLEKTFEELRRIATATGEGLAEIEELYGIKRNEILEAANDNAIDIEGDRARLMIQIAELEGRSADALAMARNLEREAMNEALHPLLDRIHALQDEALASAQAAAQAEESRRRFEIEQRLQADIMRLLGDEAAALKIERQLELYAMEEGHRALAMRKYALQDEAAAASAAAAATEQFAREMAAIANEREGLMRRLLTLANDTAELRRMDLEALAPANRALLEMIHSVEDTAAAAQETVTANNALIQSYNAQRSAMEGMADRYSAFADDIRQFKAELTGGIPGVAGARFDRIAAMARMGDEGALSQFTGAASSYLDSARNSAGSFAEYQMALIKVLSASEAAAKGADGISADAAAQIAAIDQSIAQLELANNLAAAQAEAQAQQFVEQMKELGDVEAAQSTTVEVIQTQTDTLGEKMDQQTESQHMLAAAINALRAEVRAYGEPTAIHLGRIEAVLRGVEEGGTIRVSGVADMPITVAA
jgi:hypothetical protein